jgi:transmembrane sensor
VSLNLDGGRARFDVVHNPQRFFSVHAGDVTVSVLGTQFTVERVADRVGVAVERGTVRVDWGVGSRLLRVSESGWFPPLVVGESAPPRRPAPATTAAAAGKPGAGGPGAGALSRASGAAVAGAPATGDRAAPARFEPAPTPTAEALLAAADAARMRGQADQAEALLRRLLRQRRDDPRAPLAAFTLGRLLLMELGRPRDAAAAFAEVRVLAPGGPFAEDALAREVEAWSKAKEPDKARAKGEEYLRSYPRGMRVEAVRSFSGRP